MGLSVDLLLFVLLGIAGLLEFVDLCFLKNNFSTLSLQKWTLSYSFSPSRTYKLFLNLLILFSRSLNFSFMYCILCVSWLHSTNFF